MKRMNENRRYSIRDEFPGWLMITIIASMAVMGLYGLSMAVWIILRELL